MRFPLSQDLKALDVLIENDTMEDLEISASVLERWLDNSVQKQSEKLNFYLALLGTIEARATIRRREARKLMERACADEDKAQFLESLLMEFLENHKLDVA